MTLVYTLVFSITFIELFLLMMLLLPLGEKIQSQFIYILQAIQSKFKIGLYVMYSFVTILFFNSVNTSIRGMDDDMNHMNTMFDPYSRCKIFYAQRNVYLTSITLLMGLILFRIPQMVKALHKTNESSRNNENITHSSETNNSTIAK